jgi:hypothetical protein
MGIAQQFAPPIPIPGRSLENYVTLDRWDALARQNERFGQEMCRQGDRIRVLEVEIKQLRAAAEKAARKDENQRQFEKLPRDNSMSRDRRPTFPGGDRPTITRFDGAGKCKFNEEHDTMPTSKTPERPPRARRATRVQDRPVETLPASQPSDRKDNLNPTQKTSNKTPTFQTSTPHPGNAKLKHAQKKHNNQTSKPSGRDLTEEANMKPEAVCAYEEVARRQREADVGEIVRLEWCAEQAGRQARDGSQRPL